MKLRNYKNRTPTLLRLAPYVNLEELWLALVAHILWRVEDKDEGLISVGEDIKSFSDGERSTLPSLGTLHDDLYDLLADLYPTEARNDLRFDKCHAELVNYFFYSDALLHIS